MSARVRDEKRKLTLADLLKARAETEKRRDDAKLQRLLRQAKRETKLRARYYQDTLKTVRAAFSVDVNMIVSMIKAIVDQRLAEKGIK
jgi:hypothetical protein